MYTIEVSPGGFEPWEKKNVVVNKDVSFNLEFTMKSPELTIETSGDLASDGKVILQPEIYHYLIEELILTYTCTGPNGVVELNTDGTFTATVEGKYTISVNAEYGEYSSSTSATVDIVKSTPEPGPTPGGDDDFVIIPPFDDDDDYVPPVVPSQADDSGDDNTTEIVACAAAAVVAALMAAFLILEHRRN